MSVHLHRTARLVAALAALTLLGSVPLPSASAAAAAAAGVPDVATARAADSGFPLWYQDAHGRRLAPCTDAADAQCILPAAGDEPGFDPAAPLAFPANFPSEFFFSVADSELTTDGCEGATPGAGRIKLRLAIEGAFANEAPAPNDQMVFGRTRIVVTPGSLCPDTEYTFTQPYGTATITTNGAGAVPANAGTTDVGCVPAPGLLCDFRAALASPIFSSFLHWPAGSAGLPAGYLGDTGVPHAVEGSPTGDNVFAVARAGATVASTDLFSISGRLAGPLLAGPAGVDFGGVEAGASKDLPVTVTNLDADPVTVSAVTLDGADASAYAVDGGGCVGAVLDRDEHCDVTVTFAPTDVAAARQTAALLVGHDGVRSPLSVPLTGTGVAVGASPALGIRPDALDFADQRLRVHGASQDVVISNAAGADAPLGIARVETTGEAAQEYLVEFDPCTGRFLDPGQTCTVQVSFLPRVLGARSASLTVESNDPGTPAQVDLSGNGIGGVAAVSTDRESGFPTWYQDENGVRLSACTDGRDPGCILPAAGEEAGFDPARATSFPENFPSEFFWTVADSDQISTPACGGTRPGRISIRVALEGAFANDGPVEGDQMAFGRIRVTANPGLCPDHTYDFVNPYGIETLSTDDRGRLKRPTATEDIGCAPVAPDVCDFALPLQSRVLSGFLRWDPSVAPAAPGGYIGDGATAHQVVGGSYVRPGTSAPVDYFEVVDHETGGSLGRTDLWTVAGKLGGPLVANPSPAGLGAVTVGDTSDAKTVALTNDGATPLTVTALAVGGADAADFAVMAGHDACTGTVLDPAASCNLDVTFSPHDTGVRSATLSVTHTGLNSPMPVPLTGIGGSPSGAALNVSPGHLAFPQVHVGRPTTAQTVTLDNVGGTAPLHVGDLALGGADKSSFGIAADGCSDATVAVGASCTVDLRMTPEHDGELVASLDASGDGVSSRHVSLTGTGIAGNQAVSATADADNGFPDFYQDGNGIGVVACLDGSDPNCVLPAAGAEPGFDPGQTTSLPGNFPSEFFYWVADSDLIATPGCNGTLPGRASARFALEGSFGAGAPAPGDQATFGRLRVRADGLCPDTDYTVTHPYGTETMHTDARGAFTVTDDRGCAPVAPATCDFSEALGSRVMDSFLRFDPAFGAAPAGYLGDAGTPHRVTGSPTGTNYLSITGPSGDELRTDLFTVGGKLSGGPSVPGTPVPDTATPFVALTAPAVRATIAGTVPVRAEARDNVGVASVQFRVDGVDIGAPDTTAPFALNWDSTTLGDGPHVLTAVAWDAAGNAAHSAARPVSLDNGPPVKPSSGSSPAGSSPAGRVVTGAADTVPPVVTLVGRGLLAAARLTRTTLPAAGVPVVVTFTATDAGGAGVAAVQLQRSVNGQAFRPVALTSPTATTVTVIVRPGTTTRFRARAVDTAGNIGDWATGKPFRLTVTQDTSRRLTFRGAWNSVRHSGVLGTTVHRAAAAGSSVSMRFTGSRVSWIGTRGPQQGVARVYVDGRRVATIDGYAKATQRRAVLLTLATAPGKHLIEIRATGAHRPRAAAGHLDLDAIVVISS